MDTAISALALLVALGALAVALQARRTAGRRSGADDGSDLPRDTLALRQEVAALRGESAGALKHLAVVRYDAFGDMGGQLSWSLAVLDDHGDGAVLTSIHGRTTPGTRSAPIGVIKKTGMTRSVRSSYLA